MKDNRLKYDDRWFEGYRYRERRSMRKFERDFRRLQE